MTINLKDYIASISDFPEPGIIFRDISPLVENGPAYSEAIKQLVNFAEPLKPDLIVGPESRGYIFGSPLAFALGIGFVTARKKGKLPRKSISATYNLEYGGENTLEIHADSIKPGQKVLIIDDLLATGGTINATRNLVGQLGGEVVGTAFLIELEDLKGREKIMEDGQVPFIALLEY